MTLSAVTHGVLIQFAGNTIRFDCDHVGLNKAINTHFKNCLGQHGPIIAEYKVTAINDTEFSISRDGSNLFSKIDFEQVLFKLMQLGLTDLNGASTTELIFHAGALSQLDQGLLLCGKSGSGKSTLTAWLAASGFYYLSDEVVALPTEGNEISGFCRSLVLKKGSAFVWRHWLNHTEVDGLLEFNDGSAWVTPMLLNASTVRSPVTPRIIIFPTYSAESQFQTERLSSADTLFRLLQCLVNARNFPDHGMEATSRLARRVSAYRLIYSDIENATQWIQQTITAG